MSNKTRRCEANLTYHVYSRCLGCYKMMRKEDRKKILYKVVNMAFEKYNFEIISYSIMDNHFHFMIRTINEQDTISKIMQFIKSQYARKCNKSMERMGPFWNERFGDTIIEESTDPEEVFHYINNYIINNPVKADYVKKSSDYKFSSIKFYLFESYSLPIKCTYHKYFLKLGNNFKERSKKFLELQEDYLNT